MKWQEISITTSPEAIEAISELFYRLGSGGVVIEDPDLLKQRANSGLWDAFELPEEALAAERPVVKGYLPINHDLPHRLEELQAGAAEIMARLDQTECEMNLSELDEEDWANSWKAYFKPLKMGTQIVIKPTWESYTAQGKEHIIEMDPGMAFGTGSHSTTLMCAEFLEKYLKAGDHVIDVGTGTGILSMCAAFLGAQNVLALDYDAVAVRTARENISNNHLEKIIKVQQNDLLQGIEKKAHVITANIIADIIIRLFPQVKNCLEPAGILITSGVIGERKEDVEEAANLHDFALIEERIEKDWVAQVWKMREC